MSEAPKLANCPFCGSEVPVMYGVQAICEACGAGTMVHDTEAEAIGAWNRRTASVPPVEGVGTDDVLNECLGLADLAATLTGCRGDDDYVNAVRAKIVAALRAALTVGTEPKTEAEGAPLAYLVCNPMVAKTIPVKARGIGPDATEWLYPATREEHARSMAKLMRADLIPLYSKDDEV